MNFAPAAENTGKSQITMAINLMMGMKDGCTILNDNSEDFTDDRFTPSLGVRHVLLG